MSEVTLTCMICGKILKNDSTVTIRTSGKPKWYCTFCSELVKEKLTKSGTKYIATPYLSTHAANVLKPETEE